MRRRRSREVGNPHHRRIAFDADKWLTLDHGFQKPASQNRHQRGLPLSGCPLTLARRSPRWASRSAVRRRSNEPFCPTRCGKLSDQQDSSRKLSTASCCVSSKTFSIAAISCGSSARMSWHRRCVR
jgi:hypothetical protein